jgi:murein L,D-transpeptidase YafK
MCLAFVVCALGAASPLTAVETPTSERSLAVTAAVAPRLETELQSVGLTLGAPVFLRAFKESRTLEAWIEGRDGWQLFRTWPICAASGDLGPKLAEGDRQVPEGFYGVVPGRLNPRSSYHLSMNIGYPNAYDRANGRTGSYIMIHGVCGSSGCLSMTDPIVEEIWVLVEAALRGGQREVPVHIFPFPLTEDRLAAVRDHPWYSFWEDLAPGYLAFEETRALPRVEVRDARYRVR